MRPPFLLLFILAGSYLALCALALLFQKRLVYFPDRNMAATPGDFGLDYEDVFLETSDGARIHGWFVPAAGARTAVLFCHGNGGNISLWLDTAQTFHRLGMTVLLFDYRGYGRSVGRLSEAGTYADAGAAWRHLVESRGFSPGAIVICGRSLGAAVAIELALRVPAGALIAESAFTSLADMARHAYPWLPTRWFLRMRYDSLTRVRELQVPKLFVHSAEDEIVPFRMGRRLFEQAVEPKSFLRIHGSHNESWTHSRSSYEAGLRRFLTDVGRL